MTALSMFLKPFVWPVIQFVGRIVVRLVAWILFAFIPSGRVRALLYDRTFLERHSWVTLSVLGTAQLLVYAWAGLMLAGIV